MTESPIRLLLDFDARVRRDQAQQPAFLHRRDRKFALICQDKGTTPTARQWLHHLDRVNGRADPQSAEATIRRWRQITLGFLGAGAVLGLFAMLGLLFYDGGQRINITVILGFVLLQCLLAALTTVQAFVGWQPWRPLLTRFAGARQPGVINRLQPQLMARAAHGGGVAFGIAGWLTLLVMVLIQDLAFGWSTTLNTDNSRFLALVEAIATPWHGFWPAAVPDAGLVDATRFFRAGGGGNATDPARLGDWWPFVAMLWLFYVILPRLALTTLSQIHLHLRARHLLQKHPGMTALQYRLETPTLDTGNAHNDAEHQPDTTTHNQLRPLPESDTVICWAGAGEPELPDSLNGPETRVVRAGGRISLEEDTQTLACAADHLARASRPAVIVATRSWEPPTGELQDFLEQARSQWPAASHVAIVPLTDNGTDNPPDHQLQQWLRFAERLGPDFVHISLPQMSTHNPYQREGG
ncbi:DUF2868 domain-containing protein [Marinobacter sp.]|uniref:DUF2868 domain-containing protein n=1 Tax=Marinobacter sp. TaxID=50741 RepID=UPI0034A0F3C1